MKDAPDTPAGLKQRALRYLVRREHSRAELARKLAPHAESQEAVEALLDGLLSRKHLSDERFAEERARSLSRKYGAEKIRRDLRGKGVSDDIADRVSSGLNDLGRARIILQKKFPSQGGKPEELARRARFLRGRGFSWEVICRALGAEPEG